MSHRWKLYRSAGIDQVAVATADDLRHLGELDPKLWVALSMPTRGVHLDARTLALLDTDHDGFIRRPEVLAAVAWVCGVLRDPASIFGEAQTLSLDELVDGPLLATARRLWPGSSRLTLADASSAASALVGTRANGDGIIHAGAVDGEASGAVEAIIAALGSDPDRSGAPGIDRSRFEAFFREARTLVAWHDGAAPGVAALAPAAGAIETVRDKVEDFFMRCNLAAFEARASTALGPSDADLAALGARTLGPTTSEIERLPLAPIAPGASLPLQRALNPVWRARIAELVEHALTPLLGRREALTEADWRELLRKLAPYEEWRAAKPVTKVEALGMERVRLALPHEAALDDALAKDLAVKPEVDGIDDLVKLFLFRRDLGALLGNYVNFSAFYGRRGDAVFQAGTLYLDGRGCRLVFEVVDAGKHATLGPMAGTYLAYCDCTRASGEKRAIAAAFTAGDIDNLFVGRNGIFVDRAGLDWQATITKIVDNPISVRQAFWSPYKKAARAFEERIAKRAADAQADAASRLDATSAVVAEAGRPPSKEPKKGIDIGTIAALGVAIGGIATVLVAVLSSVFGLGWWAPLGVAGVMLAISAPSMLLAYMKLRRRNLGPLLDANGWAINVLTRINVPFGTALTELAAPPKGAERDLRDPYAERRRPWKLYAVQLIIVGLGAAWFFGKLDGYLPGSLTSTTVLGEYAPSYVAPAPEKPK